MTGTGNAAASIALRNAIFRVVPRAYIDGVYEKARQVAVGDAKTLGERRESLLQRFEKLGVTRDRVFARLEKRGIDDVYLLRVERRDETSEIGCRTTPAPSRTHTDYCVGRTSASTQRPQISFVFK